MFPNVGSYFKIASFLHNKFSKCLTSDKEILQQFIERLKSQKNVENTLAYKVERNDWLRKRFPFEMILSKDLKDFPEMTEDLKILFIL